MTNYVVHYQTARRAPSFGDPEGSVPFAHISHPLSELEAGRFAAQVISHGATNVRIQCTQHQPEADLVGAGL